MHFFIPSAPLYDGVGIQAITMFALDLFRLWVLLLLPTSKENRPLQGFHVLVLAACPCKPGLARMRRDQSRKLQCTLLLLTCDAHFLLIIARSIPSSRSCRSNSSRGQENLQMPPIFGVEQVAQASAILLRACQHHHQLQTVQGDVKS